MFEARRFQKSWHVRYGALVLTLVFTATIASATPPVANPDSAFHYGPPLVVDVLTNDTEADGELLNVSVSSDGSCGAGLSVLHQLIRFASSSGAPTSCSMTYSVTDESGQSDTAQLTFIGVEGEIFSDGFESGNTNAWSFCVGC